MYKITIQSIICLYFIHYGKNECVFLDLWHFGTQRLK